MEFEKKIFVIAGAFIVFIVAILLFTNMATSAPLKISDDLVANIQAKNSSTAYSLMSSGFQNGVSSKDFEAMVNQIGPILTGEPKMQSKEINSSTDSGNTAKIVYEILGNDDSTYVFTVNLVQENNDWVILNFESTKK